MTRKPGLVQGSTHSYTRKPLYTSHLRLWGLAIGSPVPLQVNLTSGWRDLMPGFVRTQWLSWAPMHTMTTDRERNLLYVAHVNGLLKVSVQGSALCAKPRTSCLRKGSDGLVG